MTCEEITAAQLDQFLTRIGFVRAPTAGQHLLYEHPATRTEVILPSQPPDKLVSRAHLVGIRETTVGRRVINADTFDMLPRRAATGVLTGPEDSALPENVPAS